MTTLNIQDMRDELCHTLRNGDILTTTIRGVTTTTENFTATAGQTIITLSHTAVKNIRSLTVNSTAKRLFEHFTVNWNTGAITMLTGLTLNDAVAVQYDYGSGDKIFPDLARDDLKLTSYPRVGIELTSMSTEPFGLGGMTHITNIIFTVFAWVPVNKDTNIAGGFGGLNDLSDLMSSIRGVVRTSAKSLYLAPYVTPRGTGPQIKGQNNKIIQESQDFEVKFKVE